MASTKTTEPATVVAAHGRNFVIELSGGTLAHAVTRGRRADICVGDAASVSLLGSGQAVIETVGARRNEMIRSDRNRRKYLAANVDQAAIVVAGRPRFDEELLLRMLLGCEAAKIDAMVIVTKSDITDSTSAIMPRIDVLRSLDYRVPVVSTLLAPARTLAVLLPELSDRTTLLMGESGMCKSYLVNLLVPGADQQTQSISEALGTGRHTTSFTRIFRIPDAVVAGARLIDSPGFQTFGIAHVSASERVHAMRDFRPHIGKCRFHNCSHRNEPQCAIRSASEAGEIDPIRYRLFASLVGVD